MKTPYQSLILSVAKNLYTFTLCLQILHYVQDDTNEKGYLFLLTFNSTKKAVSKPKPPKISTQAP